MKYFDDIKIRLTVRGICLFEQMSNKSFFDMNDEDLIQFMYCTIVSNNDFDYSYDTFLSMCNNKKVIDFILKEYEKMFKNIEQFNSVKQEVKDEGITEGEKKESVKISDIVADLIVKAGLTPDYVYDKMQLWEINFYVRKFEEREKQRLEEQRLWTYFTMIPHLDSKKKIKPEDIIQFPWEAGAKKANADDDLKRKQELIKAIIGKPLFSSAEKETLKEKE